MATVVDVEAALRRTSDHSGLVPKWRGPTLASGFSGVALLHLYVARAVTDPHQQTASRRRAFEFIRGAVRQTDGVSLGPGLWDGSSGLVLAMADCCRDEPRFAPALARLSGQVAEQVLAMRWPREPGKVAVSHYDLVSGASGALVQLCAIEKPSPADRAAAGYIRDYLLWLSEPERGRASPWRWLITPEFYVSGPSLITKDTLPDGYLDVGLAHGAAGVLTGLAAAWRAGYRCRGQLDAMERITLWILEVRERFDVDGTWPAIVPVPRSGAQSVGIGGNQLEWCYGSTGLAAALLRAAEVTGDSTLRQSAFGAFEIALRRSTESVESLSLCHGLAGLVAGCREFAEAGSEAAKEALPTLCDRLLGHAETKLPFIYHDPRLPHGAASDLMLLNGAPGMALALLASVGTTRPAWFSALFGH
ncbi:lanthionine synthetase C family protein [Streptomyces kronopolitis]|uniref:lanthionine synthetase C family protein n=1 Tax=Streptomyces kronopolitis TaxID=1612435 RepID=UPI00367E19C6